MTIKELSDVDELHRIIIHHEVEIENLEKQNTELQVENKSLKGSLIREREYKQDCFILNSSDAKLIYGYLNRHADNQFRGRDVYAKLANFVREITGKETV